MEKIVLDELKILCELEMDILTNGEITADSTGYFPTKSDNHRLHGLYQLQDKYSYGWYIASDFIDEQIKKINEFKMFILAK